MQTLGKQARCVTEDQLNYLALCNRLKLECGVQGDPMTTTVGNTGILKKLCDWVWLAYRQIENERQWMWMYQTATLEVPAGVSSVPMLVSGGCQQVDEKVLFTFDASLTPQTAVMTPLRLLPYRELLRQFYAQPLAVGQPQVGALNPVDGSLWLNALADKPYSLYLGYWRETQDLQSAVPVAADDLALPGMPQRHHMAIVYKAMQMYAAHENAPEVMAFASQMYEEIYAELQAAQLPQIEMAHVHLLAVR